jgi:TRAP-type mannitol/chloroaromatic compound transport system permease small subunit
VLRPAQAMNILWIKSGEGGSVQDFMDRYVRFVERINFRMGRMAMYLIFVMIGILLWSSISKTFFRPTLWTLELAQFVMVAYYVLGGPYSIQIDSHVRMDLVYGNFSIRRKAWIDAFMVIFLLIFLLALIYGNINSLIYAIKYGERSFSAWRPYMWPIKSIMLLGFVLMLAQAVAELFKDIARIREEDAV